MTQKKYKVYFARTSLGEGGGPITAALRDAVGAHGPNLPSINLGEDGFQIRDLRRVGTVWQGMFARLRDDAPHIVNGEDQEREIPLDEGDRVVDKTHFLYRERPNVLVWQVSRGAGGLVRVEQYLSQILGAVVQLPQVMNDADLQRVLDGQLYELTFGYARPQHLLGNAPNWNRHAFDMMSDVHAAQAKFMLRAPRGGGLAEVAKRMVRQLIDSVGVEKVRVKLTDESDPIELFMAPLRDAATVNLVGRYPVAQEIYQALEDAYDRQRASIPGAG